MLSQGVKKTCSSMSGENVYSVTEKVRRGFAFPRGFL